MNATNWAGSAVGSVNLSCRIRKTFFSVFLAIVFPCTRGARVIGGSSPAKTTLPGFERASQDCTTVQKGQRPAAVPPPRGAWREALHSVHAVARPISALRHLR